MQLPIPALAIAATLLIGDAHATTITLLDTFPQPGIPYGPSYGPYSGGADAIVFGIPFSVPAAGRITSIETAFTIGEPDRDLVTCGWRFGILGRSILGTTTQIGIFGGGFVANVDVTTTTDPQSCGDGTPDPSNFALQLIEPNVPLVLRDLNWDLPAGDYLLGAAFLSDIEQAYWLTNPGLESDQLVVHLLEGPCAEPGMEDPWVTLADCGLEPWPVPAARITFELDAVVPEPSTMWLLVGGLCAFVVARRGSSAVF